MAYEYDSPNVAVQSKLGHPSLTLRQRLQAQKLDLERSLKATEEALQSLDANCEFELCLEKIQRAGQIHF